MLHQVELINDAVTDAAGIKYLQKLFSLLLLPYFDQVLAFGILRTEQGF